MKTYTVVLFTVLGCQSAVTPILPPEPIVELIADGELCHPAEFVVIDNFAGNTYSQIDIHQIEQAKKTCKTKDRFVKSGQTCLRFFKINPGYNYEAVCGVPTIKIGK